MWPKLLHDCYIPLIISLSRDGMLKLVHAPYVVTTLVVSDAASMTNIVPANNITGEYAPYVVTTLVVSDDRCAI